MAVRILFFKKKEYNMKKRILALLTASAILLGILNITGCNNTSTSSDPVAATEAPSSTEEPKFTDESATSEETMNEYNDKNNWLAFPENIEHKADVFYLYPTVTKT